jgi:two-component system sensor histidine kinase MprB
MTSGLARLRALVTSVDRRWQSQPLRNRLTAASALAATLAIVGVVAVAYLAVRHELLGQVDSQLRRQLTEVQPRPDPFTGGFQINTHAEDINGYAAVIGPTGVRAHGSAMLAIRPGDLRIAQRGRGRAFRDDSYQSRPVRVLTAPLPNFPGQAAVLLAFPLTAVDHQLHVLALAFVLLALAGLALTVIASWGVVRRIMRPVRDLTETAEQIAATRDLTLRIDVERGDELGRLATTFNTMLDALERSLDAQRQLVTDASHELRTPLASLRTNVEVLNDVERLSAEQRREVLDGIVTQLDELTGLVADVVELARGEASPSAHEDVAFDELVSRAVERARRHWPAVAFDLHAEPVTVRGVPGRLDRAVANMLDNAGKFTPAGSRVAVTLASSGRLTVTDAGPGVPADALPHVFDRFYRADEARALPGSGLGLAIVQQVAEGHGGRVTLDNGPAGGAVATLELPVSATVGPRAADEITNGEERVPLPQEQSLFR